MLKRYYTLPNSQYGLSLGEFPLVMPSRIGFSILVSVYKAVVVEGVVIHNSFSAFEGICAGWELASRSNFGDRKLRLGCWF